MFNHVKKDYDSFNPTFKLVIKSLLYIAIALVCVLLYGLIQVTVHYAMQYSYLLTKSKYVTVIIGLALIMLANYLIIIPVRKNSDPLNKINQLKTINFIIEAVILLIIARISLMIIFFINSDNFNTSNQVALNHMFHSNIVGHYYIVLLSIALAPFIEEFIFRWLPYKIIKNKFWAFLLGLIGFIFLHSPNSLISFVIYAIIGLILEIMFYHHGYYGSSFLHYLYNLTSVILII